MTSCRNPTAFEREAVADAVRGCQDVGTRRLRELAERRGRSEAAVRQRASRLRAARLEGDLAGGD